MADATCSSSASTLKTLIRQGDTTQHVGHQDRPILIRAGLDSIESFRTTKVPDPGSSVWNEFLTPGLGRLGEQNYAPTHAAEFQPAWAKAETHSHRTVDGVSTTDAPPRSIDAHWPLAGRYASEISLAPRQITPALLECVPHATGVMPPPPYAHMSSSIQHPSDPMYRMPAPALLIDSSTYCVPRLSTTGHTEAVFDLEMAQWMSEYGSAVHDHERQDKGRDIIFPTPQSQRTPLCSREPESIHQEQPRPSELSEAATTLLRAVAHEDSEKWQESVFLSLMKAFRDGAKDVVGSEIKDRVP